MSANPNPKIFLSYAWANTEVADEIDNDFKSIGISFIRDVRDLAYRGSIKEFMQSVGESDFVLMLISDEYLHSENCMHEVTELFATHQFRDRILPIVLDNARHIFKPLERAKYYDHWKEKLKEAEKLKNKYKTQDYIDQVKKVSNINNYMDTFFNDVADMNTSDHGTLKKENYRAILNIIGFDDERLIEEVLAITKMDDAEEREIALETFLTRYPNNIYGLFYSAWFSDERGQFKKAKKYYNDLLSKYPENAVAHCNLAILLTNQFADHQGAKEHYKTAVKSEPDNAVAHYNLATLLTDYFFDHQGAKKHFEAAIEIDPKYISAHYNLGTMLLKYFSDYKSAKEHFEAAIEINPKHVSAHYNLAATLLKYFSDCTSAKEHLEAAIEIDPEFVNAHNNLGLLLKNHFSDYKGAKKHYEAAIKIDPEFVEAYNNLAILLENHFSDHGGAKKQYETAIKIDPKLVDTRINLGNLLMDQFSDYGGAKKHYKAAIKINPKHAIAHFNLAILLNNKFEDYKNAEKHYKIALELDSTLSSLK